MPENVGWSTIALMGIFIILLIDALSDKVSL